MATTVFVAEEKTVNFIIVKVKSERKCQCRVVATVVDHCGGLTE